MSRTAFRGSIFHATGPETHGWFEDGVLVVEDGRIVACGPWAEFDGSAPVEDCSGKLIVPGFVDSHIHFPQTDIIAAYGAQLLDWLETHTFPAEAAFHDRAHCDEAAEFFLSELLRNGTTSALVFGTVHKTSVEALFDAALARDMRLIAGKALMDRNAPPGLCETLEDGLADTEALIAAYAGKGRLDYAVSPRFAFSCSDPHLAMAGEILARHPDVRMHTHLSENPHEIAAVAAAFPDCHDYLDVYAKFGLLTDRSVFAHGVHLDDDAFTRIGEAGAAIAFCPTSNLFLGSGLFDLKRALNHDMKLGLGTDVGAGTSFSLFRTMDEAYKVGQLGGLSLDPFRAFYLATLGGAQALGLDSHIGDFTVGKEADFLVLDLAATPLLARRLKTTRDLAEKLFALMILGDDRAVERTYLAGRLAHSRD